MLEMSLTTKVRMPEPEEGTALDIGSEPSLHRLMCKHNSEVKQPLHHRALRRIGVGKKYSNFIETFRSLFLKFGCT